MHDQDAYDRTRQALHTLAEHLLAPAEHVATGRIGLRQTPGGFATQSFASADGDRRVRIDGIELVVEDSRGERRTKITTLREAAAFADVEPGAPTEVYTPTTPLDLEGRLAVAEAEAKRLADWYALTNDALEQLRAECVDEAPAVVQLWPEHFDLATTISEVNYGGSPGDEGHPSPYLYVGPYAPPPQDGDFWNEPFGASVSEDAVRTVDDAVAFFRDGRQRLTTSRMLKSE